MSWTVKVKQNEFKYKFNEEEFSSAVSLKEENFTEEKSSGYQEPNDDVLNSIFFSETEHGYFEWSVRSARTGFNNYAEIESESMTKHPKEIKDFENLEFFVVNNQIPYQPSQN